MNKQTEPIKKELLKEMQYTDKVSVLVGPKGKYKLKEGKNVIKVLDGEKFLRLKVVSYTGEDSKVQKSMQDETDISNILKKYGRTGVLPIVQNEALYGDFSDVPSFQEAQNIIIKAEEQFSLLSAEARKKFDNDPAKFLEFCGDEKNKDEMIKMGLAKPPAPKAEPMEVKVVNKEPEKKDEK